MRPIAEFYIKTLQDFQDRPIIRASTWASRTIKDLGSVTKPSAVLTLADRVVILFRGILAILIWLPVHLLAVPYTLILGAWQNKYHNLATVPHLHEITPGLYLGTYRAATNENMLKQHAITSVLSVVDFDVIVPRDQIVKHLTIPMKDDPDVDIAPVRTKAIAFVRKALAKKRKVLVHCRMGKSRSAAIMAALVQDILKIGPQAAMEYVSSKRPGIHINYGFCQQLLRHPVNS